MALRKELIKAGPANTAADAVGGSATTGLTALAGGGQTGATALTGAINVIATCATLNDSALLPEGELGDEIWVRNNGAASCNVFPRVGGAINGAAANAAFAVGASKTALFKNIDGTNWIAVLTA